MKKAFFIVTAVVIALVLIGGIQFARRNAELSERPQRAPVGGGGIEREADSVAVVQIRLPYASLSAAVEKSLPPQISKEGAGETMTHPFPSFLGPGPGVSVGYRWSVLLERGAVSIGPGPNDPKNPGKSQKLAASVPISATGWGGLRGDGARLVGLDKKNFRGKAVLSGEGGIRVDEKWTPSLDVNLTHSWPEAPEIEVAGGIWINVQGQVDPSVSDELGKAKVKVADAISKDVIRNALGPEWRVRRLKIGSYAGNDIITTLTPLSAGFSGVTFDKDGAALDFSLGIRSKTVFALPGPLEPDGPPLPLPDLKAMTDADSRKTILKLPLYASYEALRISLRKNVPAEGFAVPASALGKGTVYGEDFDFYPAEGGRMAIGVKLKAKFESRFLDTRGWVWLTARPRIDERTQRLIFEDLKFTRALDNGLVTAVTGLVQTRIEALLNEHSSVDFATQARNLKASVEKVLNDPKTLDGLHISVPDLEVSCVNPIVLTDDKLGINTRIDATVSCEVKTLPGL